MGGVGVAKDLTKPKLAKNFTTSGHPVAVIHSLRVKDKAREVKMAGYGSSLILPVYSLRRSRDPKVTERHHN